MAKKVTVAVPIYNVEPYLEECVDSILAQTYANMEVILVDDGSPDRCGEICDRYAEQDSRVRVIHKENGGVSSARNAAIDAATGTYICFVDSDDYLDTGAIAALVEKAEQNNADFVSMNFRSFSKNGIEKECVIPLETEMLVFTSRDLNRIPKMMGKQLSIFCFGNLYRIDIIRKYSIRFEPMKKVHSEDQLFNLCYYSAIRHAVFICESMYNYRVRSSSLSHEQKPVDILNRRITWVRCLKSFLQTHRLPRQNSAFYTSICWSFFADGCVALGSPERIIEGIHAIEQDNQKLYRKMLWHMLCGKAGRDYIRKYEMSPRAALYFRFMILLLLFGKNRRPAETYLSHK